MDARVAAVPVRTKSTVAELATHQHRQGQLAMVLSGAITCEVPGALWIAPKHGGLWIPGGVPHSIRVTANGDASFLFVQDGAAHMPNTCCALAISPLLRELIIYLARLPQTHQRDVEADRIRSVLLDQLARMPTEAMHLPVSDEPRVRKLIDKLTLDPGDRSTAAQWASRMAMSERTLARLIQAETGMSFGRWRQRLHLIVALQRMASGSSVQDVAGELGYESVGAFILMFRKAMGKPPGRYLADQRPTSSASLDVHTAVAAPSWR